MFSVYLRRDFILADWQDHACPRALREFLIYRRVLEVVYWFTQFWDRFVCVFHFSCKVSRIDFCRITRALRADMFWWIEIGYTLFQYRNSKKDCSSDIRLYTSVSVYFKQLIGSLQHYFLTGIRTAESQSYFFFWFLCWFSQVWPKDAFLAQILQLQVFGRRGIFQLCHCVKFWLHYNEFVMLISWRKSFSRKCNKGFSILRGKIQKRQVEPQGRNGILKTLFTN